MQPTPIIHICRLFGKAILNWDILVGDIYRPTACYREQITGPAVICGIQLVLGAGTDPDHYL
jgi:hypothetical protein